MTSNTTRATAPLSPRRQDERHPVSLQNDLSRPAPRRAQVSLDFGNFGNVLAVGLIGLGFLAIGLGWNGAAGVTTSVQQTPYVLSGGLLGLALVMVGIMVVLVQHLRSERAAIEAKLDVIAALLSEGGVPTTGAGPASFGAPVAAQAATAPPQDLSGLVAAGLSSFHVPGCRLVDGRETVDYLTSEEASTRGLKACRVCQPSTDRLVTVR